MIVGDYCNRDVVIIDEDASITEAAQLMRQHHVGDLVITRQADGGNVPVGILTDRDIVIELIAKEQSLAAVTVGDVMSHDLHTVMQSDDLMDTLKQMRNACIRRMPVIDTNESLVGILTVDDVIEVIGEQIEDLVALITRQQQREEKLRK